MIIDSLLILIGSPLVYNIPKTFSILISLFFTLPLIVEFLEKKYKFKLLNYLILTFIILVGLYFRLSLAYFLKGDFDLHYWYRAASWAAAGKNIYAVSPLYNYFPPWIVILTFLKKVNSLVPSLHFYFIIRFFLTFVDLLTVYILFLLKPKKHSFNKIVAAFFLNPVTIIISGFHGQFENVAIFFILLGIYFYEKLKKFHFSWLFFTFGGIVKHMFLNQVVIFLRFIFKEQKVKIILYLFLSSLIALSTLLPYWKEGKNSIIQNLFLYSYTKSTYGFPLLLYKVGLGKLVEFYKLIFMLSFFLFPFLLSVKTFKSKNFVRFFLLGNLFFLSFTPGVGDQYFIMPLAFASLARGFWFYFYTFFTSLYLLGSSAQFNIKFFKLFSNNLVWLAVFCWFIIEMRKLYEKKGKN